MTDEYDYYDEYIEHKTKLKSAIDLLKQIKDFADGEQMSFETQRETYNIIERWLSEND